MPTVEREVRTWLVWSIAMAGGYAEDIADIVDIHFATVAAALHHAKPR